jgi:hypothetical protein
VALVAPQRGAPGVSPYKRNARAPDLLRYCSQKTHFDRDYFEQVKSCAIRTSLLDAVRNTAKIIPVNEAALSEMFPLPVADATALLSIIGLVLIGDIVARCGPLT